MTAPTILDICDELARLVEPDEHLRDDTLTQPSDFEADMLYCWPAIGRHVPDGTGRLDELRFDIRMAWAADRIAETPDTPDRSVSLEIGARAAAVAAILRAHRDGATYEGAQVTFDYEALTEHDARGYLAIITGYRLLED